MVVSSHLPGVYIDRELVSFSRRGGVSLFRLTVEYVRREQLLRSPELWSRVRHAIAGASVHGSSSWWSHLIYCGVAGAAVFVRSTLGEVGLVTAFLSATYKARLFSTSAETLVLRRYYIVRRASFNSATKGH